LLIGGNARKIWKFWKGEFRVRVAKNLRKKSGEMQLVTEWPPKPKVTSSNLVGDIQKKTRFARENAGDSSFFMRWNLVEQNAANGLI
jgi:hypothetical protein